MINKIARAGIYTICFIALFCVSPVFFAHLSFAKEIAVVQNPSFDDLEGWLVRREGRGILRVEHRLRPESGLFLDGRRGFGEPSLVAVTQFLNIARGASLRMECLLTIKEHDGKEGGAMVGLYGGQKMLWKRVFRPAGDENAKKGDDKGESKQKLKAHEELIELGKPFRYVSSDLSSVVKESAATKLVVGAFGHRYSVVVHSVQFFVLEDLQKKAVVSAERSFRVHTVQEMAGAGNRGADYFMATFSDGESGRPLAGVNLHALESRWLEDQNRVGLFEVGPIGTKKKVSLKFSHRDYGGGTYSVRCSPPFVTKLHFALYKKSGNLVATALPRASVVGRVLRGLTTRPLSDVRLTLNGKALTLRTDIAGRFRLANIAPNKEHVLLFSLPGFRPVRRKFKANPGERLQLLVGLSAKERLQ